MDTSQSSALVTGGASGLGRATATRLSGVCKHVVILDLPGSDGEAVAAGLGNAEFVPGDVRDEAAVDRALDRSESACPLRVVVHCAGRGGTVRVLDRDGNPGSRASYEEIVAVNLFGTFNVLRLAAARLAGNEPIDGDRGVIVLTSSVAAFEGQIGQIAYASAKAGIAGMTLVAARDLARRAIRVCTIAPGTFDTPILARFDASVLDSLARSVPHPQRLGAPDEFARLALHIIDNGMLNGETIRLDGAIRMPPR